jgi:hypothetical protein
MIAPFQAAGRLSTRADDVRRTTFVFGICSEIISERAASLIEAVAASSRQASGPRDAPPPISANPFLDSGVGISSGDSHDAAARYLPVFAERRLPAGNSDLEL